MNLITFVYWDVIDTTVLISQTILNTRTCTFTVFCCKERVLSSLLNGTFYEIMTPSGFMFITKLL